MLSEYHAIAPISGMRLLSTSRRRARASDTVAVGARAGPVAALPGIARLFARTFARTFAATFAATLAAALAVTVPSPLHARQPPDRTPVCVVVDKVGAIVLGKDGPPVPLFAALIAGDTVSVPGNGRLVVLFTPSGREYTAVGPGSVEVRADSLGRLSGPEVSLRQPAEGHGVSLQPRARVVMGGVMLRGLGEGRPANAPGIDAAEIERRRPAAGASFAARASFALWLEDVGQAKQARRSWIELAAERPDDKELALRAR
jgi:hypothetical protein